MADREFELWTGSDMGSSDLEFGQETGPIRDLVDQESAYCSSLGLDPNWYTQSSNLRLYLTWVGQTWNSV